MLQLTPLLQLVLEAVDGRRTHEEIAERVAAGYGKHVTAENIATLVDEKLRPMGLLLKPDGSEPELKKSNPLLGLKLRVGVTDPDKTNRITAPFAALFNPVVVVAVLAGFLAISWWLLFDKGLASATHEAFHKPGLLLLIFFVTVLSAGFHEFGHAAAARRGGSTPGVMGMGLYLFWPAFYTDVTDSYRLGRAGRLRTDLGGLYFNAIVALAVVGVWWATGYDGLLLVVATQILQMLRQLTR
jgi:putative peptide zinc metalloprotease protein